MGKIETSPDPPPPYEQTAPEHDGRSEVMTAGSLGGEKAMPVSTLGSTNEKLLKLQKPIAIPATSRNVGSPFLRAYPPTLEAFGISVNDFIDFLDTFNRVAVRSPPLQVLGLAGSVLSFVPVHNINLIGMGIDFGSKIAGRIISKGRSELLLRKANREMFGPCGLKVEVAKLDGLAKIAGIPVLNAEGEVVKGATLLEPLGEGTSDDGSAELSIQQRRLKTLEPWIASLEVTDLPDIEKRSNPMSQWSVKTSEWQRGKEEKRLLKGRTKAQAKLEKKTEKAERKLEKRTAKLKANDVELARSSAAEEGSGLEQRAKTSGKLEKAQRRYEKRISKAEEKADHHKREEKAVRKVLWLIIRPLDADSGKGENPDIGSDFSYDSGVSTGSDDEKSLQDEMDDLKVDGR